MVVFNDDYDLRDNYEEDDSRQWCRDNETTMTIVIRLRNKQTFFLLCSMSFIIVASLRFEASFSYSSFEANSF